MQELTRSIGRMQHRHRKILLMFYTFVICVVMHKVVLTIIKANENRKLYRKIGYYNIINKEKETNESKNILSRAGKALLAQNYQLFQPSEEVDFPTVSAHAPRIPHIIHQMYATEMIPAIYTDLVKSFIKNNPTWEYRFWTDSSGRKLLERHHPYLLNVYDQFGDSVRRSDLLRYAVLYEYGGLYADLDVENVRSLNRSTMKFACVVSTEPFEHSVILYKMDYMINNAIMSCRPKHPFFKQLLDNLQNAPTNDDPVVSTGPMYVTQQFKLYNKIASTHPDSKTDMSSNSPYFYKGTLADDDIDAVYVPNSQYFMDEIDVIYTETLHGKFVKICSSIGETTSLNVKRACAELYARESVRTNKTFTFTIHRWYHLWHISKTSVQDLEMINVCDIVPNHCVYD